MQRPFRPSRRPAFASGVGILALSLGCVGLLLAAPAARAQSGSVPPPTAAQSAAQVAGIQDRFLDGLWKQVDHYWHEGDYNRIVDLCRIAAEADPSFNEAYTNAAYLLWSMGDVKGADVFFQYGMRRTADPADLAFEFGDHLCRLKRYAEAEPHLRRAVASGKAPYPAYSRLAHALEKQKKYGQSAQTWEKAVKRFPKMGAAKANLERVRALARGQDI